MQQYHYVMHYFGKRVQFLEKDKDIRRNEAMKRKALLAAGFYMFAVLTACQLKKSPAEAHWKEAAESKDFYTYAAEHAGEIELSQLADEAGGADA